MTMWIARGVRLVVLLSVLLGLALISATPSSSAEILVISPHPDDDILMASGVVGRAVSRGESVRVVYMTNGDTEGVSMGNRRQDEAVAAMALLGVNENRLMFFGYPDDNLDTVWTNFTSSSSKFTSTNTGLSSTYARRGLGGVDYHAYRHNGAHAAYNHPNMVADMVDLLTAYLPTHIFVTSQFDVHTDHSTSYLVLQEALAQVLPSHPGYNPTIHKTIIWMSSLVWPNALDASAYFAAIPNVQERTGLVWSERESLDVPPSMQLTMYGNNPKYMALDHHTSQGGAYAFLGHFVHKDEFFWTEQKAGANAPPVPNAGFDQSVPEGAAVTLDGSASFDRNGDALSFQWTQAGGAPVVLSGATTARPSLIAPTGLTQDALLTFELTVSDGVLTSVSDAVNVRVAAAIPPPPLANIAPLASSVTASSQANGQPADRAVDGVIDGYPGDATKEWSSDGQGVGAWIKLEWSTPHVVTGVRLHDRPNDQDQVTAGTLLFSDASTVAVGRLPNPGAGLDVSFPPRATTSVKFTIDAVTQTINIGLAEFLVFEGSSSTDRCAGVTCTASDQCHVAGTCDPATGACSNPAKANGTSCNDGSACTRTDTCQAGACTGTNPVVCTASDPCHPAGTCNPATGTCSNPTAANGTTCSDGNGCTRTDTCQAGVCTGANPVVCTASDQCHVAGTCNAATGTCSNPTAANGTSCSDANLCTQADSCQAGVCSAGSPIICNDGNPCTTDTCNSSQGCQYANNTAACNDGNACTTNDVCGGGVCAGTLAGATNHLVISQVQTSGDSATASNDEFIEIFNPTAAAINAGKLSLIYKPVGSNSITTILTLPSTTAAIVPARGWILVARSGYNGSATPEFTYSNVNLSSGGGTVYLATGGKASCTSTKVVDKVAWGNGDCPETTAVVAPGANNSVIRQPANACGNGQDTNNNATDFVLLAPSTPRN